MRTTFDIAMRRAAAAALLALAFAGPAGAQPKASPPPPAPARPFQFPAVASEKLANGLTVFVVEDHRQPVVSVSLVVRGGAAAQPLDKPGIASLAADLLTKGTATRSAQDIAEAIDQVGGSLTASADDDYVQIESTVLKPSAALAMELVADVALHPAFAPDEIERQRQQVLSNLKVAYADPEYLASATARRIAFGLHPYGVPSSGTPESVAAIAREDLVAFHKATFGPGAAMLAIAGDVTRAEAVALATTHLGGWTGTPAPVVVPPVKVPTRGVVIVDKPDAVQTQIRLVSPAVKRADPELLPLQVANQVFGGSFNSRLNMTLRANEGLTYGASSGLEAMRGGGQWLVSTFTRTEQTGKAVQLIQKLATELRDTQIAMPELDDARAFLAESFPLRVETSDQVATRVLEGVVYDLPSDYWSTYQSRVRTVSSEHVLAAVRKHLDPAHAVLVLVGNREKFGSAIAAFGEPTVVPFAELDLLRPDLRKPAAPAPQDQKPDAGRPATGSRGMQIVEAAAAAMGGRAALEAVKDVTVLGSSKITGPMGTMTGQSVGEIVYPDKLRSTITTEMGEVVQAFDGKAGWMRSGGQTLDMPPELNGELQRGVLTSGGLGIVREALSGRAKVEALEPATVNGRAVDVLHWTLDKLQLTASFDAETHLLAKVAYRSVTPQGAGDIEVAVSDYRDVNGVKYPFTVVGYQQGRKYLELGVTEVKINTGIAPERFAKEK